MSLDYYLHPKKYYEVLNISQEDEIRIFLKLVEIYKLSSLRH